MAFLNVVKSGNLLNESNLLYAALIFYSGAGALYLGFGVTGVESYVKFASFATWAGLIANTGAVVIAGMKQGIHLLRASTKCCLVLCGRWPF